MLKINRLFYFFIFQCIILSTPDVVIAARNDLMLPVPMYLQSEFSELSIPMSQAQLTITPTSTSFTVRAISVTGWSSQNGSCSGTSSATTIMDNGSGNTVVLSQGHSYVTTDASSFALFNISAGNSGNSNRDQVYNLLDNSLSILATHCVGRNGAGVCTNATNCGWGSAVTWTP